MGGCISFVSSVCRGKAASATVIHSEKGGGDGGGGRGDGGDVDKQNQVEEEELRKLRQEAKALERERLKKAQAVAHAKLQREKVQKQLAEHEEESKRRAFDLQRRKERHAQLARKDAVRQYVLNEILDAGVNNVMNDKLRYEEIYRDWRRRNGVLTVQRLHHHYHRDGTVSVKVYESSQKRRHHRKKPHGYGYVPPPGLEPIHIDKERIESYHDINMDSIARTKGDHNSVNKHFHRTSKCWHGSSVDDYSSDEESHDEILARYNVSTAHEYVFVDTEQAGVSSRPVSRQVEDFGSKEGDYIPSGSLSISFNGFFDERISEVVDTNKNNAAYHSKFIGGLDLPTSKYID